MNDTAPTLTIRELIKALAERIPALSARLIELQKSQNLFEILAAYSQLDQLNVTIEALTTELSDIQKNLSKVVIPDLMESLNCDNTSTGGYTYSVGVRTHARILPGKADKAFEWLRSQGYDGLIQEKVNDKSLSSVIKAYIEEKGLKPPEEIIGVYQEKYMSRRKS